MLAQRRHAELIRIDLEVGNLALRAALHADQIWVRVMRRVTQVRRGGLVVLPDQAEYEVLELRTKFVAIFSLEPTVDQVRLSACLMNVVEQYHCALRVDLGGALSQNSIVESIELPLTVSWLSAFGCVGVREQ